MHCDVHWTAKRPYQRIVQLNLECLLQDDDDEVSIGAAKKKGHPDLRYNYLYIRC